MEFMIFSRFDFNTPIIIWEGVPAKRLVERKPEPMRGANSENVERASAEEIRKGKWLVDARIRSWSSAFISMEVAPTLETICCAADFARWVVRSRDARTKGAFR